MKIEKAMQSHRDATRFEKGGIEFEVAFTAEGAGKKSFAGEIRFAVCTDTNCDPVSDKLAFDVDVK